MNNSRARCSLTTSSSTSQLPLPVWFSCSTSSTCSVLSSGVLVLCLNLLHQTLHRTLSALEVFLKQYLCTTQIHVLLTYLLTLNAMSSVLVIHWVLFLLNHLLNDNHTLLSIFLSSHVKIDMNHWHQALYPWSCRNLDLQSSHPNTEAFILVPKMHQGWKFGENMYNAFQGITLTMYADGHMNRPKT